MANINSVFISITMYSNSLDKMILKTNQAVNKLAIAAGLATLTASKIQKASNTMDGALDKMLKLSSATNIATNNLMKASKATSSAANDMLKVGNVMDDAADKIDRASKTTKKTAKSLDDIGKSVGKVSEEFDGAKKSSDDTKNHLKDLMSTIGKIKNMTKVFNLADSLAVSNTKLEMVNDGSKGALQEKVFAAAGQSRSSFSNMAGYVASLEGIQGDLFGSNDESLAFAQLAQRSLVSGGATSEESKSSMDKLIESMSKGNLTGDDLTSILQSAPLIYEAISTYTGKSGEELQKLADQGQLRASDIKNAMFSMSGEINEQFASTPMTFSDIWTRVKDGGLQAFSGILEKITELVSSPGFMQFINTVIFGFGMIADGVANFIGMIVSGWDIIAPILGVVGTVLLAGIIGALWSMLPPMLAQIGVWIGMALPVLAIVAVIGVVIAMVRSLGASWEEIFGVIGGILGTFVGAFYNIFVFIWNIVADFVNYFGNVFNDPFTAIQIGILDLGITFMSAIKNIFKGVSDLFGLLGMQVKIPEWVTNVDDTLNNEKSKLLASSDYKVYMETKQMVDLSDAAGMGKDIGSKVPDLVGGTLDKLKTSMTQESNSKDPAYDYSKYTAPPVNTLPDSSIYNNPASGTMDPVTVKGTGSGGSIPVEMPDEDLDYLRDIAERDYIANVATNSLAPSIAIQFGDVHETADANKVAGRIKKILQEEIAMVSEGVY